MDVVIIGASASGLMCAIEAGKRGRKVIVLDHAERAGGKILVSGGGRCNFTNYNLNAGNYISGNPHFCKSAISRFSQWDFIAMVEVHGITYEEREHGQLFCRESAAGIVDMLLSECKKAKVSVILKVDIKTVERAGQQGFAIVTSKGHYRCESLVIATGGLSYPAIGASPFGYRIAEQFGIRVIPTSPGLVPFTLHPADKERFSKLSGIAVEGTASNGRKSFKEKILFTHRGLSGPAILQLSSYMQPGDEVELNLLPGVELMETLKSARNERPQVKLKTLFSTLLPKRLATALLPSDILEKTIQETSDEGFKGIAAAVQKLKIKPAGTEGYRTAEVTVGGVDCNALSSKTMETLDVEGLYFTGEVVDITGQLGGYNLQWAWSSGWCAGQYV